MQKGLCLFLLNSQHLSLAGAGVHHDSHGNRGVSFTREVANLLGSPVFLKFEVLFLQVRDQVLLLILHHGVHAHDFRRYFYGGRRCLLSFLLAQTRKTCQRQEDNPENDGRVRPACHRREIYRTVTISNLQFSRHASLDAAAKLRVFANYRHTRSGDDSIHLPRTSSFLMNLRRR